MKRNKKLATLILAVLCIFTLFAGCKNDPVETSPSPSPSPSKSPFAEHQTEFLSKMNMDDLITYLKEAGVITEEHTVKEVETKTAEITDAEEAEEAIVFVHSEIENQDVNLYWFAKDKNEELQAKYDEITQDAEAVSVYGPFVVKASKESPLYEDLKTAMDALKDIESEPESANGEQTAEPTQEDQGVADPSASPSGGASAKPTGSSGPASTGSAQTSSTPTGNSQTSPKTSGGSQTSSKPSSSPSPSPSPSAKTGLTVGNKYSYTVDEPKANTYDKRNIVMTELDANEYKGKVEFWQIVYSKDNKPVYYISVDIFKDEASATAEFTKWPLAGYIPYGQFLVVNKDKSKIQIQLDNWGISKTSEYIEKICEGTVTYKTVE